jgi:hypothetical protein
MQNAALAQAFNKSGRALVETGHRVVIGRARGLLDAGDVEGALSFLDDAAARLNHTEVRALSEGVRAWKLGGGDARGLVSEGAWTAGASWERFGGDAIAEATRGDLKTLLNSLVAQRKATAAGEIIEAPSTPGSVVPGGEHAIGSIFGTAERAAAVVEAPARLEERSLDLDDDLATAATVGMLSDAVRAATVTPPPPSAGAEMDELEDIDLAALARAATPPPEAHDRRFGDDDPGEGPTEAFGFDTDALSDLGPTAPKAPALALDKPAAQAPSAPAAKGAGLNLGKPDASAPAAAKGPADLAAPPSFDPTGAAPGASEGPKTNRGVLFAVLGLAIAAGAAATWYFLNN